MWCLWNREYGEHDIEKFYTNENSLKKNLDRMEWEYAKYPGTVVGDFTCIKVEYDWGKRTQRWTVKCNRCGEQLYVYNVNDWKRGKGRALQCKCRKEEKEKAKIDKSLQRIEKIPKNQKKRGRIRHTVYRMRFKPLWRNGLMVLAYGTYRKFLNLFYKTYFLWKYIEIYCRYCRWSIKKIDISMV